MRKDSCENARMLLLLVRHLQHTVGLERYWYWVIGYWAIFTDIG